LPRLCKDQIEDEGRRTRTRTRTRRRARRAFIPPLPSDGWGQSVTNRERRRRNDSADFLAV